MGLKQFTISLAELSQDLYLRNDEKYYSFLDSSDWNLFCSKSNNLVPLKEILVDDYKNFRYEEGEEYQGIPTGQSYLDEDGTIIDFQNVNLDNHPNRLKFRASNENILISSLRLSKSPALFFENNDLSNYVFSNGFYIFKVKDGYNKKFITYVLRTKKLKNLIDFHLYRGIGISAYKDFDLKKVKIPHISENDQLKIVEQIEPIERRIEELKNTKISAQKIINKVFAREFKFNIEEVQVIEKQKFSFASDNLIYRNFNLRNSVRWNKILPIQKILYKNNPYIQRLGKYITSTRNGWSPTCREMDTDYNVFGVNNISKNIIINYDDLKVSDQKKKNLEEFYSRNGDLFVSRGNTVDLVALASVVKDIPEDKNIVFPDLFIKIELEEKDLLKEYLAYLFNSIIGRYYFKYAAKGKNQTMVKISSDELNNFYLPVPPLPMQQQIIDEVEEEMSKQKVIRQKIDIERNKIDEIIEQAVC